MRVPFSVTLMAVFQKRNLTREVFIDEKKLFEFIKSHPDWKCYIPGTSVICALGQRARSDVADALRDSAPFVRIIGDAHRVSTITNAVYEGYHAALDI